VSPGAHPHGSSTEEPETPLLVLGAGADTDGERHLREVGAKGANLLSQLRAKVGDLASQLRAKLGHLTPKLGALSGQIATELPDLLADLPAEAGEHPGQDGADRRDDEGVRERLNRVHSRDPRVGGEVHPTVAPGTGEQNLGSPARLTHTNIGMYSRSMARAATTTDAFNAVAEPRRRQLLDVLAGGERSVTEIVDSLGLEQPLVSKHLRVLREVGLVRVRHEGRRRIYRLHAEPLRSMHEWLRRYEDLWNERYDRLDEVLEELKRKEEANGHGNAQR